MFLLWDSCYILYILFSYPVLPPSDLNSVLSEIPKQADFIFNYFTKQLIHCTASLDILIIKKKYKLYLGYLESWI